MTELPKRLPESELQPANDVGLGLTNWYMDGEFLSPTELFAGINISDKHLSKELRKAIKEFIEFKENLENGTSHDLIQKIQEIGVEIDEYPELAFLKRRIDAVVRPATKYEHMGLDRQAKRIDGILKLSDEPLFFAMSTFRNFGRAGHGPRQDGRSYINPLRGVVAVHDPSFHTDNPHLEALIEGTSGEVGLLPEEAHPIGVYVLEKLASYDKKQRLGVPLSQWSKQELADGDASGRWVEPLDPKRFTLA